MIRQVVGPALLVTLLSFPVFGKDKKKTNSQDPYATAELETPPPVNAGDLAFRAVVFEDFTIPSEWEGKARPLVNETLDRSVKRLDSTHAFTAVTKKQANAPEEPYLLVKGTLLNYRMVGKKGRFFGGAFAGTSYITYKIDVVDGKSGEALFQREISTENNAFAAAWSFNDKNLPTFLGNTLADYIALRARKDKGASVLPLSDGK
jgi:hypothetical protein